MSENPEAKPRAGLLTWALWGAALIGVAAVLYIIAQSSRNPPAQTVATAAAPAESHDVAKKLEHPADGAPPPAYAFKDAAGKTVTAADFKGKVVVMNLWATWCAPCKIEMPMLAKLQQAYAGKPVKVVAISIDKPEALAEAKAFIAQNAPLAFYNDPEAKLPWVLKPAAAGMPTTVIYGKDGLERGRVSGQADWDQPGAKAVIDKALAG
ncbi:MAG: redoxin domain-containing protein [Phenylobacterium sp.]|nr:MAG: redoxin domain-containing protein [Phenylobacterium sp.]